MAASVPVRHCRPTFEFTGLRGFLRRSGGMMGSAYCESRLLRKE